MRDQIERNSTVQKIFNRKIHTADEKICFIPFVCSDVSSSSVDNSSGSYSDALDKFFSSQRLALGCSERSGMQQWKQTNYICGRPDRELQAAEARPDARLVRGIPGLPQKTFTSRSFDNFQ